MGIVDITNKNQVPDIPHGGKTNNPKGFISNLPEEKDNGKPVVNTSYPYIEGSYADKQLLPNDSGEFNPSLPKNTSNNLTVVSKQGGATVNTSIIPYRYDGRYSLDPNGVSNNVVQDGFLLNRLFKGLVDGLTLKDAYWEYVYKTGALWSCGQGNIGKNGIGSFTNISTFQQVGVDSNWLSYNQDVPFGRASEGAQSFGFVKSDGTLWVWGYNYWGSLGLGDNVNRNTPTQVGTDTDWVWCFIGSASYAIKTDGTLWVCGYNGQAGHGNGTIDTLTTHTTFTQVGIDTDWAFLSVGYIGVVGFKQDGSAYCWAYAGGIAPGRFGTGSAGNILNIIPFSFPVPYNQILSFNIGRESCNLLDDSGRIWEIGAAGTFSTLIDNVVSVPWRQVVANIPPSITIKKLAMSNMSGCILSTAGDRYMWGWNGQYQQGNGGTAGPIAVPTLVNTAADTGDWVDIGLSTFGGYGIKADGTYWGWGREANISNDGGWGNLGLGGTGNYPIPTQAVLPFDVTKAHLILTETTMYALV